MTRTGGREIVVVSGRVGMYANSGRVSKEVSCGSLATTAKKCTKKA